MSSDSNNNGQRNKHTTGDETQTEADQGNDETGGSEPTLSRRSTLISTAVGLTLLSGASRTAAAQPGQRWQRDVDATGNDLLNLGGLNMNVMAEDALIADFEGSNLEIADASLNVTDQLAVDAVDATQVTAEDTVSASTVDVGEVNADEGVYTPKLNGSVTGGKRLTNLVGHNLSIVDNQLTAIDSWQQSGGFLQLSGSDISGIEVERIEPPESKNLNVESSDDLVLSISGGEGAIRIETDDGHEVVLDDESESLSVTDSGGNSVEMNANTGEVSVSASEKITLDAPEIELSADVDLNIQSGGGLNIQSGGNAEMMSSGVLDIKGTIVQLNGGGFPAARQNDPIDDEDDVILAGSQTVFIG